MFLLVRIIKSRDFSLTSVVDWIRHNGFEGEGKSSLLVSLEKDLKSESDTVEVDVL